MPIYELSGRRPVLPASGRFFVAETGIVIGDVALGEDCSVWFGAVLRGDNELIHLKENVNVQDGAVLHTDIGFPLTLERNASVGHLAMLHGCTIGEGALVGIGATVLNGARIGCGAIVGAHALVPEGREIPEDCLVLGTPARVVRSLTDADRAMLAHIAEHYVDRGRRYRAGLVLLGQLAVGSRQ
jgi:carbonic anhydrase/acetyltransferase-like protein (isoleucine patch superfamily)